MNLHRLDLVSLALFASIVRLGSISKAAEQDHLALAAAMHLHHVLGRHHDLIDQVVEIGLLRALLEDREIGEHLFQVRRDAG